MIFWKRKGILVVIALIAAVLSMVLLDSLLGGSRTPGMFRKEWFKGALLLILEGFYNFIITNFMIKEEGTKTLRDDSGNAYTFNDYSSLFFIRNKYWTYIFLALGILVFIINSLK